MGSCSSQNQPIKVNPNFYPQLNYGPLAPALKWMPKSLKINSGTQNQIDQSLSDKLDESSQKPQKILEKTIQDRAKGALVGAFMGDAAGAIYQFHNLPITLDDAQSSLKFPGGGVHNVKPAQVTDDSQLAIMLANGLIKGEKKFNLMEILKQYRKWLYSNPFDIGNTTIQAFCLIPVDCTKQGVVKHIKQNVNQSSQSNGCLMRCMPIPIWGYKLSNKQVYRAGMADASLTHQSKIPQQAVGIYCVAMRQLINGQIPQKAYQEAKEFARIQSKQIYSWFTQIIDKDRVRQEIKVKKKIGWVKIAFIYAFYYLKNKKPYREALIDIIKRGGDTDTNACIVGGLLGAACGFNQLPQDVKNQFFSQEKIEVMMMQERLKETQLIAQLKAEKLVEGLLEKAPETLDIIEDPYDY